MTAVPSFGQHQYWEERYTKAPQPYDWLNHADIIDAYIDSALMAWPASSPRILHVGCGNSELSFNLRVKVRDPGQIHNIDYAAVVIEWGRKREKAMFDCQQVDEVDSSLFSTPHGLAMPMMKWDVVDLLSLASTVDSCGLGSYAVIVDKSTCDSLACTSTTRQWIPYVLHTGMNEKSSAMDLSKSYMGTTNAVQIYAVHLALISATKARWLAYSYSSTRFWFLDPDFDTEAHAPLSLHAEVPHPKELWTLISKEEVLRPYGARGETTATAAGDTHFMYVMERTDIPLNVRSSKRSTDAETADSSTT